MDTETKTLATRIRNALAILGVDAKQTHVYDLIAAARGLRNRELLKKPYAMPAEPDRDAIAKIADKIDPDAVDEIATCVSAHAVPTVLECVLSRGAWSSCSFEITIDELSDPSAFLKGLRAKDAIGKITRNMCHNAYYRHGNDRSMDLKTGNVLANQILSGDPYEALEEHFGYGQSVTESVEEQSAEIEATIETMHDLAQEIGIEIDKDEWREQLKAAAADHLADEDDSSITNMLELT